MKLNENSVLITGASRGIGYALSEEFAKKEMHLHLLSRTFPENLQNDLLLLGAKSVRLWNIDLAEKNQMELFYNTVELENIKIDILVNNAGLLTGELFEDQNISEINKMFEVNLLKVVELSHFFVQRMLKNRKGLIVNNSSVSGKMFFPCASTYAASKAAIVAFTESLKQELIGTGVSTLLLITPGVKTKMYDEINHLYGNHLDLSFMNSITSQIWSQMVIEAIEKNKSILWPKGSTYWGVKFAYYFPSLFEKIVARRFKRNKRIKE